ncbi:unnamed protein product [Vicia faba]|uniref:Uncharacterized protein n=1 Tax=Vicia faba TaxID=3906 RepID=A0AAV1ADB8_VICFA|nr:unnamed protein product [Vicia faba]
MVLGRDPDGVLGEEEVKDGVVGGEFIDIGMAASNAPEFHVNFLTLLVVTNVTHFTIFSFFFKNATLPCFSLQENMKVGKIYSKFMSMKFYYASMASFLFVIAILFPCVIADLNSDKQALLDFINAVPHRRNLMWNPSASICTSSGGASVRPGRAAAQAPPDHVSPSRDGDLLWPSSDTPYRKQIHTATPLLPFRFPFNQLSVVVLNLLFRAMSTNLRCLWFDWVITVNGKKEKIASGLFNPFHFHLKVAQDQMAKVGYSIVLVPEHESDATWFSRVNIERFVHFVSTPEIL